MTAGQRDRLEEADAVRVFTDVVSGAARKLVGVGRSTAYRIVRASENL